MSDHDREPSRPDADTIPIFPLPNVVLLPRVRVPLYIFEPRYREMTRTALAGAGRIGMVVVLPDHVDEMLGDPPVFPIGCEGRITRCGERPDGTFDMVLEGTRRFRITAEDDREGGRLYRSARIQPLDDPFPESDRRAVASQRRHVLDLVRQLLHRVMPESAEQLTPEVFKNIDDETFVNTLSQSLDFSAPEKQQLVEADAVHERCARLIALLRFRLAEVEGGATPQGRTLH